MIVPEVAEANWGFDGKPISLEELRNPPKDAKPLREAIRRGKAAPRPGPSKSGRASTTKAAVPP